MLTPQTIELSDFRAERAQQLIETSELLLQNQRYDDCLNRSYYAIFNSIRSILVIAGIDRRSHDGVIAAFDQYFVKTHFFDKILSTIIHDAFEIRQDADYGDYVITTADEARMQLDNAKRFVAEVEQKRQDFIAGRLTLLAISGN